MKIEFIPLELTDDYERNSNTHPRNQIENIKALMLYVGITTLPLVRRVGERYGIIAGHGRREAVQEIYAEGWTLKMADGTPIPAGTIPAVFADGWSEEQVRSYVIADNQVARNSVFDESVLADELQALQDADFDMGLLGFGDGELERLLAESEHESEGLTDPDEVPEVDEEAEPVTQRGMVWLCGEHRVMCGDSTSAEDVNRLMAGGLADMWLTDPPYNVNYTGKTKDALTIDNDSMPDGKFREFLVGAYGCADSAMRAGAVFYIWHADSEGFNFRGAAADVGWRVRQCLIWVKNSIVMGRQDYHWKHEPCLYGWKDGAAHLWSSDRKQATTLQFDRPTRNDIHPTMKPVSLFEYQIRNNTRATDVVLDSFGGGGTTLIASEQCGRISRLMELSPIYVDAIITRWQNFTGKHAALEGDGRTFNEIAGIVRAA